MGTWGEGNFHNDSARDYLASVIKHHIQTIEDCLGSEQKQKLINCGESKLMPSADILTLLCEAYNASLPVSEATVRDWKDSYLEIFDQQIDSYKPEPSYKLKRRNTIEETFEILASLAEE